MANETPIHRVAQELARASQAARQGRHVEIDAQAMHIGMAHDGRSQRLVADIPLKSAARRRGAKRSK